MRAWDVQRLNQSHDRSVFDCGQSSLNEWFKERAGQFDKKDLSRTYVATQPGLSMVLGYYALSTHRVQFDSLSPADAKGLPRLDVPVILLGRLAVDSTVQGQGLGAFLLVDAMRRAMPIAEQIGICAIEVDAIDEAANQFYLKYGFRPLLDDPLHLFMPLHEIRKLNLPPFD
ncbi:MAG: GNAT family N-acetyltransferase [Pirellula sp.]